MKLLAKTSIYYILFSLVAFAVGGIIFYNVIRTDIYDEVDDSMRLEKDRIIQKLMVSDSSFTHTLIHSFTKFTSFENQISINIANNPPALPYLKLNDTLIFDSIGKEYHPFRHLESMNRIYTRTYKIDIAKSLINKSDLIKSIFLLMFFLSVSLYMVLISVNFFVSKRVWVPFRETISKLRNYKITRDSRLSLPETHISEFTQLNNVLNLMSDKIYSDFITLREFTENASHEIQTPLAIIQSKLELLIQSENLSKTQMKQIRDIYEAAGRLSKLNQFLLLITKIENLQFSKTTDIDITKIIDKYLEELAEIIQAKNINIQKNYTLSHQLTINATLAEVLVSNLLSNAIKHNVKNGIINIDINDSEIKITNTGETMTGNPEDLFERFKKAKVDSESLGLGLSLVRKIAEIYHMKTTYTYDNGLHTLKIEF
jgi:signal transduction histidine kinase